jgi:hypothetical protein
MMLHSLRHSLNRQSKFCRAMNIDRCYEPLQHIFPAVSINKDAIRRVCYIDKYGVIYNRVQKNANSNTMVLWNYILTSRMDSVITSRSRIPHLADLGPNIAKIADAKSLLITRDPYSRVLSAFLDKFRNPAIYERWGRFQLEPAGFKRFLAWLEDGGLDKNDHWNLQVKQMLFPLANYTNVIPFERYGVGMLEFLKEIGVPSEKLSFPGLATRGTHHATDADQKQATFYDADARQRVRRMFEADFAALGYKA